MTKTLRNNKNSFIAWALIFAISGCTIESNTATLVDAEWIIGTWKGVTKGGNVFYEKWERNGDTLFVNTNYHFENGDTVIGGKSKIALRNGTVFYTNGADKEISWRATYFTPTLMKFENGGVNTYQTILFKLTPENTWQAELLTPKDTIKYSLKRIN